MRKRLLVALATAGIIGGGVYGFAATLGVGSDNLAAGSDGVEACDNAVTVDYSVKYHAASNAYILDEVTIGDINSTECAGQDIQITLSSSPGNAAITLTDNADTVDAVTEVFDAETNAITAASVTGVHVAIDGNDVGTDATPSPQP